MAAGYCSGPSGRMRSFTSVTLHRLGVHDEAFIKNRIGNPQAPPRPWSASGRHHTEWPDGVQNTSLTVFSPSRGGWSSRSSSNSAFKYPCRGVESKTHKDPPCVFQHVVTGHAGLYRVDLEELLLRACAPWSLGVGAIEASHHQSLLPCCATKTSGLFFGG